MVLHKFFFYYLNKPAALQDRPVNPGRQEHAPRLLQICKLTSIKIPLSLAILLANFCPCTPRVLIAYCTVQVVASMAIKSTHIY